MGEPAHRNYSNFDSNPKLLSFHIVWWYLANSLMKCLGSFPFLPFQNNKYPRQII